MKVALITFYAVTNIGDKILTDVVSYMLKQNKHQVSVIDINARYPFRYNGIIGWTERFLCKIAIKRNTKKERNIFFRKKLRNIDYIIFGGGQILEPSACVVNENINIITQIAREHKIPISYNAIGFFRSNRSPLCTDLKEALNYENIKYFTYRESLEKFMDPHLFLNNNVILRKVCDSAVWCSEVYKIKRKIKNAIKVVGINVIYAEAYKLSYYLNSTEIIDEVYITIYKKLSSDGYDCYFFTNGVTHDTVTLDRIQKKIDLPDNKIKLVDKKNCGKSFVQFLNQFDFIISSRLHTSICSYSLKIPTIALSWDPKIDDFYRQIGCSNKVFHITSDFHNIVGNWVIEPYKYPDVYDDYRMTIKNSIPGLI